MNILHYFLGFPPLHSGGLMIYATDLAKEQLKMGHNVTMIMPGIYIKYISQSTIMFYNIQENLPVYQIINPQPVTFLGTKKPGEMIKEKKNNDYKDFLIKHDIEILHIHSLIGFPKELLESANDLNIKTIFTTHDYFGLCPAIYLFKYTNESCDNYNQGRDCVLCNHNASSPYSFNMRRNKSILSFKYPKCYKLIKKIYNFFKTQKNTNLVTKEKLAYNNIVIDEKYAQEYVKFRKYYKEIIEDFDIIIFNSSITKNEYTKYINLNDIKYKILAVTHSKIKDNRNIIRYKPLINNKIQFLFMGYLDKKKGFFDLVDVLNTLKEKYTNWQLNIYGDYSNIDLKCFDKRFFKFYGTYNHNELPKIFSNSSVLIVPSKWKETFGFIGLEAYSYGIPSIVSENVGFSDLVMNNINGIIFKEDKQNKYLKKSIIDVLENPSILKKFNNEILKGEFKYTMEKHTNDIINYYHNI